MDFSVKKTKRALGKERPTRERSERLGSWAECFLFLGEIHKVLTFASLRQGKEEEQKKPPLLNRSVCKFIVELGIKSFLAMH